MNNSLKDKIDRDFKKQSKQKRTPESLIEIILENGVPRNISIDDFKDILNKIDDFKMPPESLQSVYIATYDRRVEEQWGKIESVSEETKRIETHTDYYGTYIDQYPATEYHNPVVIHHGNVHDGQSINKTLPENIRGDFAELHKTITRSQFIESRKYRPKALETNFILNNQKRLTVQTGALTVVAAPTGHGKTTMLISALIDLAYLYPDKRHYLLTYEEEVSDVMLKAINAYINRTLSRDNKKTIDSYYSDNEDYFKSGMLNVFEKKEKEFWSLVESGTINIIQCSLDAESLMMFLQTISNSGFVGIDYIQLVELARSTQIRREDLKTICLGLKDVAISTGMAITVAAQFNRTVISPDSMATQNIADAADIERAANKVIGLWNGSKHRLDSEKDRQIIVPPGKMFLKILKARNEESDVSGMFDFDGNIGLIDPLTEPSNMKKNDTREDKESVCSNAKKSKEKKKNSEFCIDLESFENKSEGQ